MTMMMPYCVHEAFRKGKDKKEDKHANSVCLHNSQTALFLGRAVRKIDRDRAAA